MTLHKFGDVSVAGVPFFVMDPGEVDERREPGGAQGRTRPRQSRGRLPAARRNPDDRHGGEPALPRRRRRVGLADGRRRGARHAGDEGPSSVRRRHERGARAQERRALRRHLHARRCAAEHRRRRLHAPRAAALLRAESRQEGAASKIVLESFDNDIVPATVAITAARSLSAEGLARRPTRGPGPGRDPGGAARRSRRARPERRRTRGRAAARDQADRLGGGQDEGAHHRRRQLAQFRAVLRRHRQRDARAPPDSA